MVIMPKKIRRFIMFETLKEYLVKEFPVKPEDVTMEAELVGDLGINSLELADLILLCEDKFNIVIDDEEIRNFITVGDVVRYLEKEKS
jgi:acyl carrier protein